MSPNVVASLENAGRARGAQGIVVIGLLGLSVVVIVWLISILT
jgi:hypothetical protein